MFNTPGILGNIKGGLKKINTIYKDKRNKVLTEVAYGLVSPLKLYYRISYQNRENLESLKNKPFIIVGEHERYFDIPIFDFLLKKTVEKDGYFIMRGDLPKWLLEPIGGIYTVRPKEVLKRRVSVDEARKRKEYLINIVIPYLLKNNNIIVTYVAGTRNRYKKVTTIRKGVLENLLNVPTTLVVVGIKYENVQKPFSKVTINVGEPFQADNLDTIMENIIKTFYKPVEFV